MRTKKFIALINILFLVSCSSKTDQSSSLHTSSYQPDSSSGVKPKEAFSQEHLTKSIQKDELDKPPLIVSKAQLLGIWTDAVTGNASFRIDSDSLLNVEFLESFRWDLIKDTFILYYPDEPYKARVIHISADTFQLRSEYGDTATYWRFND